jgi:hypothetical protein
MATCIFPCKRCVNYIKDLVIDGKKVGRCKLLKSLGDKDCPKFVQKPAPQDK